MKRLGAFIGIVILVAAVWLLQAAAFDLVAGLVSYDYVPGFRLLNHQMLNLGIFLACVFAAVSVMAVARRPLQMRDLLKGVLCIPLLTGFAVISCAGLFYVLYAFGIMDISEWKLAFPRRHAVYFGMELGYDIGSWFAILLSCAWILRARLKGN